jgi:hypothetical protein
MSFIKKALDWDSKGYLTDDELRQRAKKKEDRRKEKRHAFINKKEDILEKKKYHSFALAEPATPEPFVECPQAEPPARFEPEHSYPRPSDPERFEAELDRRLEEVQLHVLKRKGKQPELLGLREQYAIAGARLLDDDNVPETFSPRTTTFQARAEESFEA